MRAFDYDVIVVGPGFGGAEDLVHHVANVRGVLYQRPGNDPSVCSPPYSEHTRERAVE